MGTVETPCPLVEDINYFWNSVFEVVELVHNLETEMPSVPYPYQKHLFPAKAKISKEIIYI